jgi:hypothetical protein
VVRLDEFLVLWRGRLAKEGGPSECLSLHSEDRLHCMRLDLVGKWGTVPKVHRLKVVLIGSQ